MFSPIEKQNLFLDPFVLEQLQAGNFLVRKTTVELTNLSVYVLANDHSKTRKLRRKVLKDFT